jgi:hypothetical protein
LAENFNRVTGRITANHPSPIRSFLIDFAFPRAQTWSSVQNFFAKPTRSQQTALAQIAARAMQRFYCRGTCAASDRRYINPYSIVRF